MTKQKRITFDFMFQGGYHRKKTANIRLLNLALAFGSMIGNYAGGYIKEASDSFTFNAG